MNANKKEIEELTEELIQNISEFNNEVEKAFGYIGNYYNASYFTMLHNLRKKLIDIQKELFELKNE